MRLWTAFLAALVLAGCTSSSVPPDRLPRYVQPPAPRVALVLGSGGPRGFAHIGVLKVLEEAGIKPDLIVGASSGAIVGAIYAAKGNATEAERAATGFNVLDFFESRMLGGALASGAGIQDFVNRQVGNRPLESLPVGLVVTATRVSDRKLVIFNRGDTGLAVRASSASPGQVDPVRIGDHLYIDGDETAPVPILVARLLGARVVIAVDVSAYDKDTPPNVPKEWIVKDARRAEQVKAEAAHADVLLHPNVGYYSGYSEEYRRKIIAIAESYTREQLPAIRAAVAQASSTERTPARETSR